MCGSTGISVSRRGLPAVITSNNSFSLEDKSPFLGADMLVINSLQLDYNGTNKTQRSLLNGCFPWLWQSADARAWRLAQIELSFGMYHCVLLKGVQAKKTQKKPNFKHYTGNSNRFWIGLEYADEYMEDISE